VTCEDLLSLNSALTSSYPMLSAMQNIIVVVEECTKIAKRKMETALLPLLSRKESPGSLH